MSEPEMKLNPSSADKPDLDWSQVRETVQMLNLAVAQISGTLHEGDESVNHLASTFTSMVGNVETANIAAENLPDSTEKETIRSNCQAVAKEMQNAIIAFQFYDKLTQRLGHVADSLHVLSNLVSSPEQLYNPYAWRGLQEKIKSNYTVEGERAMFDIILSGRGVDEALALAKQIREEAEQQDDDDVELF